MKEVVADSPQDKLEQSLVHFENWMNVRTGDINFFLNTIIKKVFEGNNELPVYGLIDTSNICVMGHSLGGSAALGVD